MKIPTKGKNLIEAQKRLIAIKSVKKYSSIPRSERLNKKGR